MEFEHSPVLRCLRIRPGRGRWCGLKDRRAVMHQWRSRLFRSAPMLGFWLGSVLRPNASTAGARQRRQHDWEQVHSAATPAAQHVEKNRS